MLRTNGRLFSSMIVLISLVILLVPACSQSTPGTAVKPAEQKPFNQAWQAEAPLKEPLTAANANQGATLGDIIAQQVKVVIAPASFPVGAAPTVTLSNPPKPPEMSSIAGLPLGSPVSISIGDKPTRLNKMMQVTLRFDKSKLPAGTTADRIWATFYNGEKWEYFRPDSVDLALGTMTFSSGHMSLFGTAKITVDQYIENTIHSRTAAEVVQKEMVDEIVNKVAENAIDNVLKERLGIKEDSTKYKIYSSALKDDEWVDIAQKLKTVYSNGPKQAQTDEVADVVQTLNTFIGKKLVENIDEGALEGALKKLPGSGGEASKGYESGIEWTKAGSEAAGYLAEKNYREAARIIGSKIADNYKIVKVVKASAEIIDYRINVWKHSEVEAAFKVYRDGASTKSAYGYDCDKGDFNTIWDQMRALGERLQMEAVAAEKAARLEGGQPPPSEREEEIIRAKVKTNMESEFKARAAKEGQIAKEEAELKSLMDAFKAKGLLDDASGYRFAVDTIEFRFNAMIKMRDKILRDTAGKKLTNADIAELAQSYFSGGIKEGEAAYAALLKKKYGIELVKATPTTKIEVSITPARIDGEKDKSYTFTATKITTPANLTYAWTISDKPAQKGASNTFTTGFAADGYYAIRLQVLDAQGKEVAAAEAGASIKTTPTPVVIDKLKRLQARTKLSGNLIVKGTQVWNDIANPKNNTTKIINYSMSYSFDKISWQGTSFTGLLDTGAGWTQTVAGTVSVDGSQITSMKVALTPDKNRPDFISTWTLEMASIPLDFSTSPTIVKSEKTGPAVKSYFPRVENNTRQLDAKGGLSKEIKLDSIEWGEFVPGAGPSFFVNFQ